MVIVFRGGCFKSLVGAHLWSAIIGGGCYDAVDRGAQPRSYRGMQLVFCRSAPVGREFLGWITNYR
jgi:hypothetical protein